MATSFRCVACRATLVDGGELRCPACRRTYPRIEGVPVLVADPAGHITSSAAALERLVEGHRARVAAIDAAIARGASRPALPALRAGLVANGEFLSARRASLGNVATKPHGRPIVPARLHPELADTDLGYIADVFDFVRQDWAEVPDCRDDVTTMATTLDRGLATHVPAARRAAFLGAGLARLAYELAPRFESTLAVDLSLAMALAFRAARDGITVYEINERNAYDVAGVARPLVARIPDPPAGFEYIVADARALPVADASIDAVVSVFFTDLVRMPPLLREAKRVLAPGGAYVHFGPLGYHFQASEEMWSASEVRDVFARHGFELRDEAQVPIWMQRSNARMSNVRVDCWSFVAVLR